VLHPSLPLQKDRHCGCWVKMSFNRRNVDFCPNKTSHVLADSHGAYSRCYRTRPSDVDHPVGYTALSAASGGPSGTDDRIHDNGVLWQYVATVPTANDGVRLDFDGQTNVYDLGYRRTDKKLKRIADLFRCVFGDAQFLTRVRPVLAGQLGGTTLGEGLNFIAADAWGLDEYLGENNVKYQTAVTWTTHSAVAIDIGTPVPGPIVPQCPASRHLDLRNRQHSQPWAWGGVSTARHVGQLKSGARAFVHRPMIPHRAHRESHVQVTGFHAASRSPTSTGSRNAFAALVTLARVGQAS
jgi:hypothetical protein